MKNISPKNISIPVDQNMDKILIISSKVNANRLLKLYPSI